MPSLKMKICACGTKPKVIQKVNGFSKINGGLAKYYVVRCANCTKQTLGALTRHKAIRDWNNDLVLMG